MHRDLKPENVLRSGDGRLKVVDFGIARTVSAGPAEQAGLTLTGTRLGTPGYMAPEQLRGQSVDARVDVFRARVLRWVVIFEALLLACLMGVAIRFTGLHDGTAAQLVIIALLLLLSLIVIEPATTRASLPS